MSDIIRSSSTWWAQSSKHARWTAVGTTAIVLALALITWSVWVSPAGPVSTAVHQALGVTAPKAKKVSAAELQTQLDAAQDRIWALEGKLDSRTAQAGSRGDQITELKAQIASLQSQLGAAKGSGGSSSVNASGSGANGAGASGSGTGSGSVASDNGSGSGSGSGSAGGSGTGSGGGNGGVTNPNPGPSTDPGTTPVAVPTKAEILGQQSRWYGLYTAQSPFNWAEYDEVSRQVGTASNMTGFFQGFDQAFNASAIQRSWANGRVPLMTWETAPAQTGNDQKYVAGYTNQDITDGDFDAYLTKYAKALKANGQPMVIRLDHEMNGSWYNWSEGDAQQNAKQSYVKMWQHVHDVFQANGANDYVIWNWAPSRIDKLGNAKYQTLEYMQNYYPGADYVDWVGMSGYYRTASEDPTYANTFAATVQQLREVAPGKKILLSEIGATESGTTVSGGQKSKWINSLFDALADPANADIIGFSYFSETATTVVDGVRSTNDWRLNSRADSLQAFAEGIKRNDIDYDLQEVTP
ncbi:glycosyl hydrolase family 26 [Curtobacterium sp. PhB172]|uniref:glycoside hydrolase family 26 protein n=1 Tax=Curtobacterium sp. PhB172 TaxID=2485196 RepID=UPI000F4B48EB|nr:glycosyl hydrolase [Curtobacterium sp. PhB172]ROS63146.1 glycosyl hydrolase family 26 [Curtobacterium sp. PhB172]